MAPEFASNVAHCDHIPVSLIKLRPRVKLGTRNRLNLLVGEVDIFDAAWWAEQQRLRFFESPTMEDTADGRPGLEYSSGEDSDMDMVEEVGEEMGEAVDMGEGMGEAVDMDEGMGVRARRAARQKGSSFGPMKEDADRDYSWACA